MEQQQQHQDEQQQQQQRWQLQFGLPPQQPAAQPLDETDGAAPAQLLQLPDLQQVPFSGAFTEQFARQVRPLSPAVVCVGQAARRSAAKQQPLVCCISLLPVRK